MNHKSLILSASCCMLINLTLVHNLQADESKNIVKLDSYNAENVASLYAKSHIEETDKVVNGFNRWTRLIGILNTPIPSADGKMPSIGRGEIVHGFEFGVSGLELTKKGDTEKAKKHIEGAIKTLQVCNKVVLDYDKDTVAKLGKDGEKAFNYNKEQIAFVMSELIYMVNALDKAGYIAKEDLVRTRKMVESVSDYWNDEILKTPNLTGMSNWVNRCALNGVRVADFLESELKRDADFAKERPDLPQKIKELRTLSRSIALRCMDYPYLRKVKADGVTLDEAIKITGKEQKETPAPQRTTQFGVTEDSTGYAGDSIFTLLCTISELPKADFPELTDEKMLQLCQWLKDWQSMIMPSGAVTPYGDSDWGSAVTWIAVFEKAADIFSDSSKYGNAAANFRDTALSIYNYQQNECKKDGSLNLGNIVISAKSNVAPEKRKPQSILIKQQNTDGNLQVGKIVLRGNEENQAFAMFGMFYNASHSHGDIGCLIAHSVGDSVLQHEASYDAGEIYFHQQPLIRPVNEEFFPFETVFKDSQNTILQKGNKKLPAAWHQFKDATLQDEKDYSYAKIVTNFRSSLPNYTRAEFTVTRHAVMDKASGALMIFDVVKNNNGIKEAFVFSPTWHAQNILDKNANGFLCQDDYQGINLRDKVIYGKKTVPYYIEIKGSSDSYVPDAKEWKFVARNSRNDVPKKQHLYLKGETKLDKNQSAGVMSLLMAVREDTTNLENISPQIKFNGNNPEVNIGDRIYYFNLDGLDNVEQKK